MTETLPLVTLYLSERCNSRCISCDYWRHGKRDLTLDTLRGLLPELAALGTRDVLVSGGEPLLNSEWREIATLLRSQGLNLWLLTSGLALAKHAREAAALFDSITVSLDGTNRQTYAAIRGIDAFAKVCEGIRAVVAAGAATGLRITLQQRNYRELTAFVALARELGVDQISFLAVDTGNAHAFARRDGFTSSLALAADDIPIFDELLDELETAHEDAFSTGLIAESCAKLRRIRDYFAAVAGRGEFPTVHCNAPEFSAVVGADGRVSPCFFIAGPDSAPHAPELGASLNCRAMRELRASIRAGERGECRRCVCSMWRDPARLGAGSFRIDVASRA